MKASSMDTHMGNISIDSEVIARSMPVPLR